MGVSSLLNRLETRTQLVLDRCHTSHGGAQPEHART
jgi:hypothetical protein